MKSPTLSMLLGATMMAGMLATPVLEAAHAQSVTAPARSLALSIGRGELVTLPGKMADVFVANDAIADVQVKASNQLYVFGKAGGETTVYASNSAGAVIWSANVRVGTNLDSIDQMLHLAMPEARIATSTMNNTVLLTGTVGAPEDAAEAERLVKAFVGEKTNVISRLKMATPLQVSLHVKFAEVSRTLVRNLGMNWTSIDSSSGFKFGIGQGRSGWASTVTNDPNLPLGVGNSVTGYTTDPTAVTANNPLGLVQKSGTAVSALTGATTLVGQGKLFGLDLLGALDAGETIGLVTTLSEPNLTALSGETADFLAGGEYPIPISQGLGATSVEYKKYGVSLSYTPTVLADGRISIRVRPEVSELSSDGAVTLNGYSIPALTIRRAETTIELGSGQSFMIAGLMRNGNQNSITKLPGAGDLPILGSLFRSTAFKKGETELVIVVTPYLVHPVDANDIKLPTDGFRAADAVSQLLGNMENNGVTGGDRHKPSEKPGSVQPAPKVGALDRPAEVAPADDRQTGAAPRSKDKKSAAAAPGFNLK
ncbi:type II and III secretion system protein family protein [Novosphingobium olei]|uniref:Type II and III secretion system protein family protein n=1 Tax=Novosphingobium olei TaxID=2728851 RepID=A0A7Y0BLG0_9SPHN|nr:type II and III secretion system protein family protein [Novosphingobium olei]NML92448.1 type II and III secretion system protein family protein [Novosphingobium olei]BEV01696.1 type II and III secretion system protein family protein [Novosphingobium olei]